jgi:hypothetical protein
MDQRICTKCCVKNKFKQSKVCWPQHLGSLLWVKKQFINGTSSSQNVKMLMTKHVQDTPACQQLIKMLQKMIMEIRWITIIEKKAQNCGKTSHAYCTSVLGQPTRHCLFIIFRPITAVIMPQLPYSPDLPLKTFLCFKNRRNPWKDGDVLQLMRWKLYRLKSSRLYQKVLWGLKKTWHKCIISDRDYFEVENIDIDE